MPLTGEPVAGEVELSGEVPGKAVVEGVTAEDGVLEVEARVMVELLKVTVSTRAVALSFDDIVSGIFAVFSVVWVGVKLVDSATPAASRQYVAEQLVGQRQCEQLLYLQDKSVNTTIFQFCRAAERLRQKGRQP